MLQEGWFETSLFFFPTYFLLSSFNFFQVPLCSDRCGFHYGVVGQYVLCTPEDLLAPGSGIWAVLFNLHLGVYLFSF